MVPSPLQPSGGSPAGLGRERWAPWSEELSQRPRRMLGGEESVVGCLALGSPAWGPRKHRPSGKVLGPMLPISQPPSSTQLTVRTVASWVRSAQLQGPQEGWAELLPLPSLLTPPWQTQPSCSAAPCPPQEPQSPPLPASPSAESHPQPLRRTKIKREVWQPPSPHLCPC